MGGHRSSGSLKRDLDEPISIGPALVCISRQRHEALVLSQLQTPNSNTSQQESANASQHDC
jgi:hypothetical protein